MNKELKKYIELNLKEEKREKHIFRFNKLKNIFKEEECCDFEASVCREKSLNLKDFIEENNKYSNFQELLFKMIDDRNLKDSDVYNKVHIDRRLFSKIRNDKTYHPSKETVILIGLSLELNENEIEELLNSVSYSLPKNNHYDLIIRFCFMKGIYKISDVNELLDEYNCKLFNY